MRAWLIIKNFFVHLFGGGEDQIAFGGVEGERHLPKEVWAQLPEAEQAQWEPLEGWEDRFYRRKDAPLEDVNGPP